jgi:hypothetical protein
MNGKSHGWKLLGGRDKESPLSAQPSAGAKGSPFAQRSAFAGGRSVRAGAGPDGAAESESGGE